MQIKYLQIFIPVLFICIGWAAAVDNPQGNNPVCGPCSSYGIGFNGPLEYTPYPEPLNDGAQNPGNIYVVYSVIRQRKQTLVDSDRWSLASVGTV